MLFSFFQPGASNFTKPYFENVGFRSHDWMHLASFVRCGRFSSNMAIVHSLGQQWISGDVNDGVTSMRSSTGSGCSVGEEQRQPISQFPLQSQNTALRVVWCAGVITTTAVNCRCRGRPCSFNVFD